MLRLANTVIDLWKKSGPLYLAALALLGMSGCGTVANSGPTDRFMVAVPKAQFFKYGPAQAFGADFQLPQGQRLTMVTRQFGYSKVKLDDGTTGYMATEDLKVAPPEPPKIIARNTTGGWFGDGKPRHSDVMSTPADPLFDVNDVPLPMPDSGASGNTSGSDAAPSADQGKPEFRHDKPKPGFRY